MSEKSTDRSTTPGNEHPSPAPSPTSVQRGATAAPAPRLAIPRGVSDTYDARIRELLTVVGYEVDHRRTLAGELEIAKATLAQLGQTVGQQRLLVQSLVPLAVMAYSRSADTLRTTARTALDEAVRQGYLEARVLVEMDRLAQPARESPRKHEPKARENTNRRSTAEMLKAPDEHIHAMAKETFAQHALSPRDDARTRRVASSRGAWQGYWFRVTFVPGQLFLSGDLDNLTVTHYQALRTWQQAVDWMASACFDYFMSKTSAKKVFDREASIRRIIAWADEAREADPADDKIWKEIGKYLGEGHRLPRYEPLSLETIERLRQRFLVDDRLSAERIYEEFNFADWYGATGYDAQANWQYEAFRLWAKLVQEAGMNGLLPPEQAQGQRSQVERT